MGGNWLRLSLQPLGPAPREFLLGRRPNLEPAAAGRDGAEREHAILPAPAQIRPHPAREER